MNLDFNSQGNLHQTISLTYEEFVTHFETNARRKQQLDNALPFFRIFHQCGCHTVYVDGSFVSKKKYPEDIDLCFDITPVDMKKLEIEFPQFFDINEIGTIHRDQQCHIFYFNDKDHYLLDLLSTDRDNNPKGLIKLDLRNIIHYYDQK